MFSSSQGAGVRSLGSAYKRAWKADFSNWMQAVAQGYERCGQCWKHYVPVQIVRTDELAVSTPYPNTYRTILACPSCGITGTCSVADLLVHPRVTRFIDAHPRWMIGPEAADELDGQSVIRTCLCDWSSSARLTVIVRRQTLQVLATYPD
jgi:hypothetical protein